MRICKGIFDILHGVERIYRKKEEFIHLTTQKVHPNFSMHCVITAQTSQVIGSDGHDDIPYSHAKSDTLL